MTSKPVKSIGKAATQSLVSELAQSVVQHLVQAPGRERLARIEDSAHLLYNEALAPQRRPNKELLAALRHFDPDSIDHCITEAARMLGEDWLSDRRSFAEVAWASASLYDFCKDVGRRWDNLQPPISSQSIVLATIDLEMHLLGPTMLAQRLRRSGHSVSLMCNVTARDILERLATDSFDGLMISTATQVGLERVVETIKEVRAKTGFSVPIAVGGAVLEFLGEQEKEQLGADLVTNDMVSALGFFGDSKNCLRLGAAQ